MIEKFAVIILAGGKGLRMGHDLPKQFIEINGKPIIFHTIEKFIDYNAEVTIVLALPNSHLEYWQTISADWTYKNQVQTVIGGKERFFSVKNALETLNNIDCVAIHDGVRPLLSTEFLKRIFSFKKEHKGWVPVIPLVDSIRQKTNDNVSVAVNRADFMAVQTPQIFDFEQIKRAYQQPFDENFTDDASVFEQFGENISTFAGESTNLKITTPQDLIFAEHLLSER
ncbi:MAG: 2-C-methyl-D-erythritol 4-phosphate cytidylyltransferase [Flavobacteriales bacterium]